MATATASGRAGKWERQSEAVSVPLSPRRPFSPFRSLLSRKFRPRHRERRATDDAQTSPQKIPFPLSRVFTAKRPLTREMGFFIVAPLRRRARGSVNRSRKAARPSQRHGERLGARAPRRELATKRVARAAAPAPSVCGVLESKRKGASRQPRSELVRPRPK